jgi:hypothetical protein
MSDELAKLKPPELAAFYGRLADGVDAKKGTVSVSLSAMLMRQWLKNRDRTSTFTFDPPAHLKNRAPVVDVLEFHRKVFLSQEKARFTGNKTKWAGVVPRLVGQPGFTKWDPKLSLKMEYESLVEMPLLYQYTGTDEDRDILYGLRGFQLKSSVTVVAVEVPKTGKFKIMFQSWQDEIRDRYDWDYSEHLTVPNPDFGSTAPGAVTPSSKTVLVYHSNAKRLEDASLAAPYDVRSRSWHVTEAKLMVPAEVEAKAKN